MAEVMDAPADALDRPEGQPSPTEGSPLPPPPPPPRRRERDSRERRDDYYDSRNRSPPPPLVSRDREYRRRSSLSPPPYRDRRHSPPRRSPPPGGFKRSRRDDGGYERRRGSPRYGYDYGGYDRGGRGGYDERAHGRYMTRPSDWPDTGRGGFDGSQPQREGLMTYKQFIQELEDDILPAEAERSSHYPDPTPSSVSSSMPSSMPMLTHFLPVMKMPNPSLPSMPADTTPPTLSLTPSQFSSPVEKLVFLINRLPLFASSYEGSEIPGVEQPIVKNSYLMNGGNKEFRWSEITGLEVPRNKALDAGDEVREGKAKWEILMVRLGGCRRSFCG